MSHGFKMCRIRFDGCIGSNVFTCGSVGILIVDIGERLLFVLVDY